MFGSHRGFYWLVFAVLTYFIWLEWETFTTPAKVTISAKNTQSTSAETPVGLVNDEVLVDNVSALPNDVPVVASPSNRLVALENDVLRLMISLPSGEIQDAALLEHTQSLKNETPISLLQNNESHQFKANPGLIWNNKPLEVAFDSAETITSNGITTLILKGQKDGITYERHHRLSNSDYSLDIEWVVNAGDKVLNLKPYGVFKRDTRMPPQTEESLVSGFTGLIYSTPEAVYEKIALDELVESNLSVTEPLNWIGFSQHYFATAFIPVIGGKAASVPAKRYVLPVTSSGELRFGFLSTLKYQPINGQYRLPTKLYIGPKIQRHLERAAPHLDLAVDYGILYFIGQPMYVALSFIERHVGNWGIAIIIMTILVKLALFPFSAAQYRSMASMRRIQPKMEQLKAKYGDNRQQMSEKLMKLYKEEKVNPLGGCLLLLMQMPIFIALYWVLYESIELRHAPFFAWIHDLAAPDPFFILPILMGVTMFLMQKMTPTPANADESMYKMMKWMPVIMTVFFLFFPAGLVLYWFVSNVISLVQQWWLMRDASPSNNRPALSKS